MPLCVLNIIFAGYILERDKIESLAALHFPIKRVRKGCGFYSILGGALALLVIVHISGYKFPGG